HGAAARVQTSRSPPADAPSETEAEEAEPEDGDFVRVTRYIPEIQVELKYATEDNVTGEVLYDFDKAYLRYGTVKKLKVAWEILDAQGYSLKIWDAFRPVSAQFPLWDAVEDSRYLANPYTGYSGHSRGNCVDVTLVYADGTEVEMPTGFDDFCEQAGRDYSDLPAETAAHALLLETVMLEAGFLAYEAEWWHYTDATDYEVSEDFDPARQAAEDRIALKVSAVGDCILATGYDQGYLYSFEYYMNDLGVEMDYFFSGVSDILAQDDLTIANAESVFTTRTELADKSHQGERSFWFKSDPSYARIYAQGSVEAVNTANNHSHDYGEAGYQDSIQALEDAGVTPFGYGLTAYYEAKGVTIALLGYNAVGRLEEGVDIDGLKVQIQEDMDEARERAELVIASFHWGEEYEESANETQIDLARFTADLGADLILGHHPHVLQETEQYNDTFIAYSLGNFVYGGARQTDQRETMILSSTFYFDPDTLELLESEHEEIAAYYYGENKDDLNDYRPVLR
ncbi:MAG: CapA family protein, partial [Clostridiales bacterium]|nr:CapA family protein [Clostridiales bacterium]